MRPRHLAWSGTPLLALLAMAWSTPASALQGGGWTVVAWNDLGMHCMDGDYSVWSILPPFNTVRAQLVDPTGDLATDATGITLTYEAVADPTGSIDKTSIGKTNYWTYANALYGGSSVPDSGLVGNDMPGPANVPQPMAFDANEVLWHADGIPLTPFDDAFHSRTYPLMKIVARDAGGNELASTTPVLPISTELDCRLCHGSGSVPEAMPAAGWVFERSSDRDYRLNILRIHDDRQLGDPTYQSALAQRGYRSTGLYDTVVLDGTPVLCAGCHLSNALPGTGLPGISALTAALHSFHASVIDPENGMTLDASANRSSCYRCHPGSETGCLRGAMGAAVASDGSLEMQCQNCHGTMSAVGDATRVGWLQEPSCQNCHTGDAVLNNGQIRYTDAFEGGAPRVAVNDRFATNPDVPATGFDLYRFSAGHGGLSCEACHGSTHAVYPASHPNDNLQSIALQGHVGPIAECSTCHSGSLFTVNGGPHGVHNFDSAWVNGHSDTVENGGSAQCQPCHGTDYRGTVLSRVNGSRTYSTRYGTKTFFRGEIVTCYACHLGPSSDDTNPNRPPAVQDGTMTVGDDPVATTLVASDPDGNPVTLRLLTQPAYGRVGLVGTTATYVPNPGFAGTDSFTFAASDGSIDGGPGTVTVTRLANASNYGKGYAGGVVTPPTFAAATPPTIGTTVTLTTDNVTGTAGLLLVVYSTERASLVTNFGGLLLTELSQYLLAPLPPTGAVLSYAVPADTSLIGYVLHAQDVQFDPAAPYRLVFSNGLTLAHGL